MSDGSASDTGSLKLRVKLSYAWPRFTIRAAYVIIQVYGQLYYMQLGAKLRFMAFYTAIGRALDVITDPAMGWITDSTRTAFGRRKPYLFLGIFLYTGSLGALFFPPKGASADFVTHWYGGFYCLFFAVDTFCNVPYYALGMELTSDYEQRNSLYFWQHVLGQLGTMIGGVLPAVLSDFMQMELRDAYAITGWSFGAWYSLGIAAILLLIKERPMSHSSKDQDSPPLVREMLRIFRNQAFVPWMMAYVLDYAAIGILATMVPLFSQYVLVEPDSTNCKQQCYDWDPSQTGCTCAKLATEWLGWVMAATFLAAMVSVPFWMWIARRCKKHNAWLIYSWFNALTGPLRIFCGKGSIWLTAIFSAINGSAFGGQFIGESVMADLSDYDEFLYGDRAEGMLAVIATLGPKMVLVVCFVIPLATVATAGFRDSIWPEDTLDNMASGVRPCEESAHIEACPKLPQPQNDTVILLTRLGVSVVPTLLALASNYFKWRFPLKKKEQLDEILEGVKVHKQGGAAKDPISGHIVSTFEPIDDQQRRQMWALEMWGAAVGGSSKHLRRILRANAVETDESCDNSSAKIVEAKTWRSLQKRAWCFLIGAVAILAGSLAGTAACFPMLEKESTSWVPTSLCICCGSALVFTIVSVLRLKAALRLSHWEVPVALLQVLLTRAGDIAAKPETGAGAGPLATAKHPGKLILEVPAEPPAVDWRNQDASLVWDVKNELFPFRQGENPPCPWRGAKPRRAAR